MEITGVIITGIRTLIGVVYPPFKKKYFDQPKIYLRFEGNGASRIPGPPSAKNDFTKPLDAFSMIRIDKLKWRYKLVLRNNSEHTAYNLKLLSPQESTIFSLEKKIDNLKPLLPSTELVHDAIFQTEMEGTGLETADASDKHPDFLFKNKFVLEYTNVNGTKFYTIFNASQVEESRNKFSKKVK